MPGFFGRPLGRQSVPGPADIPQMSIFLNVVCVAQFSVFEVTKSYFWFCDADSDFTISEFTISDFSYFQISDFQDPIVLGSMPELSFSIFDL